MKILIDMNLSPDWVAEFNNSGFEAMHWKDVGEPSAEDEVLMKWARENNHVVFTHDLDFGAMLRLTRADGPSVIQVRTQDVSVLHLGKLVMSSLKDHQNLLEKGALLILDEDRMRVRILPL